MPVSEVYMEDCMATMRRWPDKFIDLAIVDPPTGQNEGKRHISRDNNILQKNGKILSFPKKHIVKDWDSKAPEQAYYDELFRVSRYQIIMCEPMLLFSQKETSSGRIVWNLLRKNDFSACQIMWTNLFNKVEYFEYLWNRMIQGVAINERKAIGNKKLNEKRIHPSQKPGIVYGYLLDTYCKSCWKVYDSHVGSGTLRREAYKRNIEFYGSENDSDYWEEQEAAFAAAKHIQTNTTICH